MQRGTDGLRAIHAQGKIRAFGQPRTQLRQHGLDAIHRLYDVRARGTEDDEQDGGLAVGNGHIALVLRTVAHNGDVLKAHGPLVRMGDDQFLVVLRRGQLITGIDQPGILAVVQQPLGQIGVGARNGGAHRFHIEPHAIERVGDDIHAHGRQRAAAHRHFAHAFQLGNLLGQHRGGRVIKLRPRQGIRGDGQNHDGRARRIHFPVAGVGRHGGQGGTRRIDGPLHIAGRAVDVAVQIKLQRHIAGAEAAARCHFRNARNAPQRPLQRRRHGGGHCFRACARHGSAHNHHGHVHLRQRSHRQQGKGGYPRQQDGQRQQGGCHRPADKGRGNVQRQKFRPEALAPFPVTPAHARSSPVAPERRKRCARRSNQR